MLELLIVMAILGVMVGLAAPPFLRMIEQQRRLSELAAVRQTLAGLPMRVRALRKDAVIRSNIADGSLAVASEGSADSTDDQLTLQFDDLPTGWAIEALQDIRIRSDGVCYGGEVRVKDADGRVNTFDLVPPLCAPVSKP